MMRLVPLFALAAMLAAVLAFGLAEPMIPAPAPVQLAARSRPAPAPAATIEEDALDDLVETMLARPLLTPTRRGQDAPAAEADGAGEAEEEVPRLAGVLLGPSGGRAIFAPMKGRPLVLTEGDSLGQYTVTAIAPNTVTLTGSEGDRLIRPSHAKRPPVSAAPRKAVGP